MHRRQPLHTYYVGAHLFTTGFVSDAGNAALQALRSHAPDAAALAGIVGADTGAMEAVYPAVVSRLESAPLDDLRVDFEDGLGARSDADEDAIAAQAAADLAAAERRPEYTGIRIKPFAAPTAARALRTLDLFLGVLQKRGGVPPGFVVTLPKVERPAEATTLAEALTELETAHGIDHPIPFEIMIETGPGLIGSDGKFAVRALAAAAGDRLAGVHFGTYDFQANLGIPAAHQHLQHPACEFARRILQTTLAGTGIHLSDGSTNRLPVGDEAAVHQGWRRHYADVTNSLATGFRQGWDLHPAQLVTRYAALYAFYLADLSDISGRLRRLLDSAGAVSGDVLDDPATGHAMLGVVRRAVEVGAITADAAAAECGLTILELTGSMSFSDLLASR